MEVQGVQIGQYELALQDHPQVWMPTQFGIGLGELLAATCNSNSGRIYGKVLELGIGSGVLSILAGKLGAKGVVGLDVNPDALETSSDNWNRNSLPTNGLEVRHSDLFYAMREEEKGSFTCLICNPPTFPAVPKDRSHRATRNAWEFAGENGREILDAVIIQGGQWLCEGGNLFTIATSPQGWDRTQELLSQHWKQWSVKVTRVLPLADYYKPYIDGWLSKNGKTPRLFRKNGKWCQKLFFIRATKL